MDDWDYVIKTNVSTWLDIAKIVKAVDKWEGSDDRNIYGARFIANDASRKVPFPRGHFMILSRFLVEGIITWAPKLLNASDMPRTDDTLLCLSLLYHLQKVCGDIYADRLMEVPAVNSWQEGIQDAQEWTDALSVRCKDEVTPENAPDNMRKVHKLKRSKNQMRMYRRPMGLTETKYGMMSYGMFQKICAVVDKMDKKNEEARVKETPQLQTPPKEDRIEQIRKRLTEKKQ